MSDTQSFKKLKAHILSLSVADNFDDAKLEWIMDGICVTKEFDQCPCGQKIKEHCYLKNDKNDNTTYVGNVCVRKFMGMNVDTRFKGLKRIRNNISAKPNTELIKYARDRGFLYGEHEFEFLTNVIKRHKPSEKQMHWLQKINRRIIERIVVRRIPNQINNTDGNDEDDDTELEN